MTDEQHYLDALAAKIRIINEANGWDSVTLRDWESGTNFDKIPSKLALVHSEVSEALEAYRHLDLENFIEEMADVVIRVLDTVGGVTDDFHTAVMDKIEHNASRGYKHGGKRI